MDLLFCISIRFMDLWIYCDPQFIKGFHQPLFQANPPLDPACPPSFLESLLLPSFLFQPPFKVFQTNPIVCIDISTSPLKPHPLFFPKPTLNWQAAQAQHFQAIPPSIVVFHEPPSPKSWTFQALRYEVCYHTCTPLHTPKTLEMCKKEHALFDSKSFKVCGRSHV